MYIIHYINIIGEHCWHKEPTKRKVKNFIKKYKYKLRVLDIEFVVQED